jgi:hypothetical protein
MAGATFHYFVSYGTLRRRRRLDKRQSGFSPARIMPRVQERKE